MANVGFKSTELFKKFIQTCFWHLFLPHSSSDSITISNYSSATNTYFPDYAPQMRMYEDIRKEIPYRVRLERPELTSTFNAALAALVKLIEERKHETSLAPIFTLARALYGEDMQTSTEWSILLQVLCAYSSTFEGNVTIDLPTGGDTWTMVGRQSVSRRQEEKPLPPFWRWYLNLIYPSISGAVSDEEQEARLSQIFGHLFFPFAPNDLSKDTIILPLPNAIRLQTLLKAVSPKSGDKTDSAVRLYSAIQFVTFGMNNVDVIGDKSFIPTDISDFNDYLKNAASKEASIVSRYNITDFDRSQVAGALESFRMAELEAIKEGVVPDGEDDRELDDDSHDPNDDDNLDPDIDRAGDTQIGNEATDLDDDHEDDNEDTDNTGTEEDAGDDADDSDGGNSVSGSDDGSDESDDLNSDDPPSGDGFDGGSDDSSTDGSDNPDGQGGDQKDQKDDKEVSSKNAMSRKAYKAIWGRNPFKLANDSDVEGYLYRSQLCRLNRRLQMDPGDAIPKSTKSTLNEWCKFWVHATDVRCSISLVKKLGLTKYLRV